MNAQLILTVMADDQPGIVEKVSSVVADHQGNWQESRMARMAGKFAGIVRVDCPETQLNKLLSALDKLQSSGIRILVDHSGEETEASGTQIELTVTGNDRPGIIQEVSHCLAQLGANVLNLDSHCGSAAMSAGAIFVAKVSVCTPAQMDQSELVQAVEELSDDLVVDIT